MPTWLIFLILLWPLLWVIRVLFVTRMLMGLEFRAARATPLRPSEVPAHVREAAKAWLAQLEGLSFSELGGWSLNTMSDEVFGEFAIILHNAGQPVRAIVQPYGESARSGECWASLRTTLRDGTELITASHATEELLALPQKVDVEVLEAAAPADLVQRHLARLVPLRDQCWSCPDLQSAAVREQHVRDAMVTHAYGTGALRTTGEGTCAYRIWPAIKRAAAIIRRAAQLKKRGSQTERSVVATTSPAGLLEFDFQQYRQQGALLRGKFTLRTKAAISIVSFVIFAGVLAWQYSTVVAATLLVGLVIHECGHLLGMRLFGYRDTQLLFVPFFGGAAIGHDDKVLSPWKHIVIILLGPLPGIFIALALMVYASAGSAPAWVSEAAVTILVLNAFNLLPILPLDGGQVVDHAFASRFPRLRVVFLTLSALGLIAVGMIGGGARILFGMGVATLIRLPVEWRLVGLRRGVRAEFPDGGEEEPIVRRLVSEMREPEWQKTPMAQRLQLVRALQNVLRMPRPGLGTMMFACVGFTAPLWLGSPLALWAVARQGEAQVAQARARAEAAGLMAATTSAVKASDVSPENNAAVPYEEASTLIREEEGDENVAAGKKQKVVALLRTAAQKTKFVPVAAPGGKVIRRSFFGFNHGGVVTRLTTEAEEKLRFNEGTEAIAISVDALKLLRLMQGSRGFLNWSEYRFAADAAWNTIEESLAGGVKISPAQLDELRRLCAEETDIAFATAAIPRGLLIEPRGFDGTNGESGLAGTSRIFAMIQRVNPIFTRVQVESFDHAVALQKIMQGIAHGDWPQATTSTEKHDYNAVFVMQLGNLIARQRQAKVALAVLEQGQHGVKTTTLDSVETGKTSLLHPYTRQKMQLAKRGSVEVLSFSGVSSDDEEYDDTPKKSDMLWRLPTQPI